MTEYLRLLSAALRNTLYRRDTGNQVMVTRDQLWQAKKAIAAVAAQFPEEIARLQKSQPTPDPNDLLVRMLLLKPLPQEVWRFLESNRVAAHTLIAPEALENLEFCISDVVSDQVPGDLIECGVFRGGASIFMRGVLQDLQVTDRKVWLADSFAGLPIPDRTTALKDAVVHAYLEQLGAFKISLADVQQNVSAYGLLDEQVGFLPGWFQETLPTFSHPLAVLRCDGDWYESTVTVLEQLYDQVSSGGYVIIDDYNMLFGAYEAVNEFRQKRNITQSLIRVNDGVHYWRKP